MKVAVIQINATDDKEANIKKAASFVARAIKKKADFILLPEFFACRKRKKRNAKRGKSKTKKDQHANLPEQQLGPFISLAQKNRVFILAGSVYERSASKGRGYNTAVLINDKGNIDGKYRKINLFEAIVNGKHVKEGTYYKKGEDLLLRNIQGFNVGITICYDLRFPSLYKKYAQIGAEIFCVPSSFTKKTGEAHWETLLRARAIENLCYVLAPNQIGVDSLGLPSYGNSMIIDPWGKILARASADKEEIIYAELKKEEIKRVRGIFPEIKQIKVKQ